MRINNKTYKKLRGFSSLTGDRLYMGDDEILIVSGYLVEFYRLISLSNIESILVVKNNTLAISSVFLVILAMIGGFAPFLMELENAIILAIIMASPWILIQIYLLIQGTSCECSIQTAAQTRTLTCIRGERRVNRLLQILQFNVDLENKEPGEGVVPQSDNKKDPPTLDIE